MERPALKKRSPTCHFQFFPLVIPGDKSPGPDGYGSHFFKDVWDIIGDDCIEAVLDFF